MRRRRREIDPQAPWFRTYARATLAAQRPKRTPWWVYVVGGVTWFLLAWVFWQLLVRS